MDFYNDMCKDILDTKTCIWNGNKEQCIENMEIS